MTLGTPVTTEPREEDPRRGVRGWLTWFDHTDDDGDLAAAYRHLMRIVGVLALLLAPVVAIGDWLMADQPLRGSISSYYWGSTGAYFVGTLCALGVFFLSYDYRPRRGHEGDNLLGMGAAAAAVVVALVPTSAQGQRAAGGSQSGAAVHVTSAVILFVLLAVFCLYQFTKSRDMTGVAPWRQLPRLWRDDPDISTGKRRQNAVYRICGWAIVLCLALGVLNAVVDAGWLFWIETAMVWAFGIAWMVKSQWFGDLEPRSPAP